MFLSGNARIDFLLQLRTEILSVLVANSPCFMSMLQLFEVKTKTEIYMQSEKKTDDLTDCSLAQSDPEMM